jgi:peptidyl-prolyl cis-trans isomerase C
MTNCFTTASRWLRAIALVFVLLGAFSCGGKTVSEDATVAEVGGRKIKMRQVTDYIHSLSVNYPTPADEYKARARYLDRLIENQLLVIGGYARTLDADIGVLEAVDAEKEKFLLDELYRKEVIDKAQVADAELRAAYDHWFDRITFRHIVVKDRPLADSLLGALRSGADFGDIAERFSLDQNSRYRAGDIGRPFGYNELPTELAKTLVATELNQLGGPVNTDMGWHIVMPTAKIKLQTRPFEDVKPAIEASIRRGRQQTRRTEHLDELKKAYPITFDPQTLQLYRSKMRAITDTTSMPRDRRPSIPSDGLTQAEKDQVMYTFGDGLKVGLGEFCAAVEARSPYLRPDPVSDEQMHQFAFENSLYDILHQEGLKQHLDESPIYKERVQEFLEAQIADRMRNTVLARGLVVTDSEAKAFYEAYPDSFAAPAAYHCREILLYKKEDAERLAQQLRAGASFEQLARQHTQRAGLKSSAGDLGLVTPQQWSDFYEPASKLKPGEWTGPLEAVDQWSLLQLIDVQPAHKKTYDESANTIFDNLQRYRRDSVFHAYVDSMRIAFPVSINQDALHSGLLDNQGRMDSVGVK